MSRVGPYGYARRHRWLEVAGITAVLGLFLRLAIHLAMIATVGDLPLLLGLALSSWLLADLLSGLVHWAADTLGEASTPLLGANLIRPFREHHDDPQGIVRHDFIETNGNNCLFALPWLALSVLWLPDEPGPARAACWLVGLTMAGMVATNQIHKWAHDPTPRPWVRTAQRLGVILSPQHHDRHHRSPHDRCYCITTGWLDGALDRVRFFRLAERVLAAVLPRMLSEQKRAAKFGLPR